jgi:type VI secretion system protein ImpH
MAAAGRRSLPDLTAELIGRPGAFDFVQAMRVAEDASAERGRPIGSDEVPAAEGVRLRGTTSLAFAPSPVGGARATAAGRIELLVDFLGLLGPSGVLPQHYTELAIRRLQAKDPTFVAFVDLLQHRAASLFHRAARKYRVALSHEHAWRWRIGTEPFERALASLVGRGSPALSDLRTAPDRAWILFAGHFARGSRSAQGLEKLLEAYLGAPVRVRSFVGRWLEIPEEHRSALPRRGAPGRNHALGADCVLGSRSWDVQSSIGIEIGPLGAERFVELRPDGEQMRRLRKLVEGYLDRKTEFDVAVLVASGETLPARLSAPGAREARLGWTTWLTARDPARAQGRVRFSFPRT